MKKLVGRYTLNVKSGEYSFGEDAVRAAYDRAVEDVIRITQGQGWSDYEGTLYYPDDVGIENIGDAIKRELYSQQQQENN